MTDVSDIKGPGYRVWYDDPSRTIHLEGVLRLSTSEYRPIDELIERLLAAAQGALHLRMTELNFLNSSGINMLYKFAIAARKKGDIELFVHGSSSIPWQGKSLPNLKKFLPTIVITLD
jgi:hypothetical protein